jgi:nitrous oxidase accessory protein NosD
MSKFRFALNILAVAVFSLAISSAAQAQATRTWVSGVGDDANPCSRTAPCKTFAGAISKTATCGEISVLDPGGFGAVTITKAITINGDGTLAGILAAGVNGIIVNAGTTSDVIIRGISINGACSGLDGIRFLGGRHLHVENCTIYDFTDDGIDMLYNLSGGTGQLTVENTSITNVGDVAVRMALSLGTAISGQLDHVRINRASIGFDVLSGSATIANSAISHVTNQAVVAENPAIVNASFCTLTNNGTGISAFNSGATIRFNNCNIFNNNIGVNVAAGATGDRFGSSALFGNPGGDTVGTTNLRTAQ